MCRLACARMPILKWTTWWHLLPRLNDYQRINLYNFALYNNKLVAPDDLFRGNFTVKTHLLCTKMNLIQTCRCATAQMHSHAHPHTHTQIIHFFLTHFACIRLNLRSEANVRQKRMDSVYKRDCEPANIYRRRIFIWHEISLFYNKAINAPETQQPTNSPVFVQSHSRTKRDREVQRARQTKAYTSLT